MIERAIYLDKLIRKQWNVKKIVISKSYGKSWVDDEGILRINIIDFLLDANSLNRN